MLKEDDSSRDWGPNLRADIHNSDGAGWSKYLCDGSTDTEWRIPTIMEKINPSINYRDYTTLNTNEENHIRQLEFMTELFMNSKRIPLTFMQQSTPKTDTISDPMNVESNANDDDYRR